MNFQTVAANNGNLVAMFATVLEIGNSKLNTNNKPFQPTKLRDDNNEEHNVTINKGNGELLGNDVLGHRLAFNLSTYQGTTRDNQPYTGYSGFWNDKAQVNQPVPSQAQEGSQQPVQSKKSPNTGNSPADGDKREMRIIRGNALNAVMSATEVPLDMVKNYLVAGVQWILTGTWDVSLLKSPPKEQSDHSDVRY